MTTQNDAFAKTVDVLGATVGTDAEKTAIPTTTLNATIRPAILPRADSGDLPEDPGERYAKVRLLGAGGMGEVVLAEDRDIGRNVAVKYLTASHDRAALARFVDEIRIVGSLEHPNIVPIHDVGVDENNQFYFVMKHVEGDTLEHVIERLAAGDAEYHKRYTFTARTEIFLALLRALEFAHAHGYVHRDIKPANIMVGRFGEVVLMDWGVAKRKSGEEADHGEHVEDASKPIRERLFTTRRGAIVGTPAYMSPEQARGDIDAIDERSDVYCASVVFHELITLRHYLGDVDTLEKMLAAIQTVKFSFAFSANSHPTQGLPPAELLHVMDHGLAKDPAARFQSSTEMIYTLEGALDGRVKIECPFTLTKRITRELGRFVDTHPVMAVLGLFGGSLSFVALLVYSIYATFHAHG